MRQQQKIFASPLRICAIALVALCIASTAPGLALAASHSRQTTLEDLYALGLSAQAGEKAEDILLRAHAGDTRAMALTTVGYDLGINGFPAHRSLSWEWGQIPWDWDAAEMSRFLSAYWVRHEPLRKDSLLVHLLDCEVGRRSPLAPLFKKAGLFDVEQRLAEILPDVKPNSPEKEAQYKELSQSFEDLIEAHIEYVARFRSAAGRVLTDDDEEYLVYQLQKSGPDLARLVYYIATTHDLEKDAPDFQPERLIRYSELRYRGGSKENAEETTLELMQRSAEQRHLLKTINSGQAVSMELMRRISLDQEEVRALIRWAHDGEAAAMRRMAANYLGGEMGFLYSPGLAWDWYECAAMKGDAPSMLALAEGCRLGGYHDEAWIWANLAVEYSDSGTKDLAARLLQSAEQQTGGEVSQELREKLQETREHIESQKGRMPEAAQ